MCISIRKTTTAVIRKINNIEIFLKHDIIPIDVKTLD